MKFLSSRPKPLPEELKRRSREALALFDAGEYASAERAWEALLTDCDRDLGPAHPETITTLDRLGSAMLRQRRPDESADRHREAHRRAVRAFGRNDPATLIYAYNLGCALVETQQWGEGLPVLTETLRRQRSRLGKSHPDTLATARTLGASQFLAGDTLAALQLLGASYNLASEAFGPDDPLTQDLAENLGMVLRDSSQS
ncbi:tetratricopeptide repeat protein [Micromonospora sp. WMMD961]|uniref:tetratricopeptide repeat protein n=1 Tax=Micromonospora sp. WMMD961 TaxID=3016100 RepID=UPI002417299F|nr:tetratricopeptide repeat protein [Micromonospora sp. WMMD961]MDG4781821.1 tetratricopeptide repeat protein [Micromonospora sp. WMMD961]